MTMLRWILLAMASALCAGYRPVLSFTNSPVQNRAHFSPARRARSGTSMVLDGATLHHVLGSAQLLADADLATSTIDAAMDPAVGNVAASMAADPVVGAVTQSDNDGWFGAIVNLCRSGLEMIHGQLESMGVPGAYGIAIILFTTLIKLATLPLTVSQLESTTKMQMLQPKIKAIQNKYANTGNTQAQQNEVAMLYQESQVNPLAGCLPSLAQIPIFIAFYRALISLAKDGSIDEPFLWLPSLDGPVQEMGQGLGWLTEFTDGHPPLGWADTAAYLTLPVILVATQFVSQKLMQPANQSPEQQQSQAVLKFLPFMLGWFALSVPSGLAVYWIFNNLVTTATTVAIKAQITADMPDLETSPSSGSAAATVSRPAPEGFKVSKTKRRASAVEQTTADGVKTVVRKKSKAPPPPPPVPKAAPPPPAAAAPAIDVMATTAAPAAPPAAPAAPPAAEVAPAAAAEAEVADAAPALEANIAAPAAEAAGKKERRSKKKKGKKGKK